MADDLVERVAKLIHPQAWNDWQYREPNRTEWRQWARRVARQVIAEVQAEPKLSGGASDKVTL